MSSHGSKSNLCSSLIQKLWTRRKVSKEEEDKEISKWKHLPDEILELIMKRMCLTDYLALRKICSPWRTTVTNAIANKICFPLPEPPLVVLRSIKKRSKEQSFFSLRTEHEHFPKRSSFEITKMISCHGSIEGWMIMMDYVENGSLSFFFFNPVTNHRISVVPSLLHYPSNSQIQANDLPMGKMVASCTPDCYNSEYFLAGLFRDDCHIAYYRLFDKSWNMIEIKMDPGVHFLDAEIMGSKLYVIIQRFSYSMLVHDLKDYGNGSPTYEVSVVLPQISTPFAPRIIDNPRVVSTSVVLRSLAKHVTLKKLFLIYTIWDISYKSGHVNNSETEFHIPPEITAVEVFKLNMDKEPIEWIKCESLDDDVIFVGHSSSMAISRTSLNCNQELIRENSVYFAVSFNCRMNSWKGIRLGIKHLTNSSVKYFSVKKSHHSKVPILYWLRPSV